MENEIWPRNENGWHDHPKDLDEIEILSLEVYPIKGDWFGTPARWIDQNAKERRCWIEGYKAALSKGNWTDELMGYLSDKRDRLYAKRDFYVLGKQEAQIKSCDLRINLLEDISEWIKAKTTT